jgi:GNAT superfamily N-acetyltransferase
MPKDHMLTTRPLAPGDFEAWFPLWGQYLAQSGTKMRWPDRVALFGKLSKQQDGTAAMVVECKGEILGIAQYQIHIAQFAFESAYIIQDLYILPDAHKSRAGAALMNGLYDAARVQGVPAVYWMAAENIYRGGTSTAATSPFLQFKKAA